MDVHTNKDAVLYFWRDIFPILKKKHPHVRITFLGTSPPEEISRAAQEDARVNVTGFVDDIRPYLKQAAVMVVPIRIGSGTRLKILDAMAMGKAIVSTSVGCEGLAVTHGKDILIADAPGDFADRTVELLTNKDIRTKLQYNARCLSENYDWGIMRKKHESVYQYVIEMEKRR